MTKRGSRQEADKADSLKLVPMNSETFTRYMEHSIPNYAKEKMRGNDLSEAQAMEVAKQSFEELLPKGEQTPENFLFDVFDELDSHVGILWFALKGVGSSRHAFVFDVEIDEQRRGQGWGEALMKRLESEVSTKGVASIRLHVFGHNQTARNLYEKLGYFPTSLLLKKDLGSG